MFLCAATLKQEERNKIGTSSQGYGRRAQSKSVMSKQFGKVRSWLTWLDKRKKNLETPKEEANEKWAIESQKAQKLVPSVDRVWSRAQIRTVIPQSDSLPHFTIELSLLYLNSIMERTLFARETEPKIPHLGTWAETRQYIEKQGFAESLQAKWRSSLPFSSYWL